MVPKGHGDALTSSITRPINRSFTIVSEVPTPAHFTRRGFYRVIGIAPAEPSARSSNGWTIRTCFLARYMAQSACRSRSAATIPSLGQVAVPILQSTLMGCPARRGSLPSHCHLIVWAPVMVLYAYLRVLADGVPCRGCVKQSMTQTSRHRPSG